MRAIPWRTTEKRIVLGLGHAWDPAIRMLLLGRGFEDAVAALAAYVGRVDAVEVERRMLAEALTEFRSEVQARAGAHRLVGSLDGRIPLAVATNSRRVLAELALTSTGFDGRFQAVVCAEDVQAPESAGPYGPVPYRATESTPGGMDMRLSDVTGANGRRVSVQGRIVLVAVFRPMHEA